MEVYVYLYLLPKQCNADSLEHFNLTFLSLIFWYDTFGYFIIISHFASFLFPSNLFLQTYFFKFIKIEAILLALWLRVWNPEPDCLNLTPNLVVNHLEWCLVCSQVQTKPSRNVIDVASWIPFLLSQFKFLVTEVHPWVVISSRIWEF